MNTMYTRSASIIFQHITFSKLMCAARMCVGGVIMSACRENKHIQLVSGKMKMYLQDDGESGDADSHSSVCIAGK